MMIQTQEITCPKILYLFIPPKTRYQCPKAFITSAVTLLLDTRVLVPCAITHVPRSASLHAPLHASNWPKNATQSAANYGIIHCAVLAVTLLVIISDKDTILSRWSHWALNRATGKCVSARALASIHSDNDAAPSMSSIEFYAAHRLFSTNPHRSCY